MMILHVLICGLVITGVHVLFWSGMLLDSFGDVLQKRLPYWLIKPLFGCMQCMSSVYGTVYYGLLCCYPTFFTAFDLPVILGQSWLVMGMGWIGFMLAVLGLVTVLGLVITPR